MAKHFKDQTLMQDQEIVRMSNNQTPFSGDDKFDLRSWEDRIREVGEIKSSLTGSEDKAIEFFNIGFPFKGEAGTYLYLHALEGKFVFIVYFHTLSTSNMLSQV